MDRRKPSGRRLARIWNAFRNRVAQVCRDRKQAAEPPTSSPKREALARRTGVCIAVKGESRSPQKLLSALPDAPALHQGHHPSRSASRQFTVGIVGSRRCSLYGLEQAAQFAGVLAQAGLTVVSGSRASTPPHTAAHSRQDGGRTVGVLGTAWPSATRPTMPNSSSRHRQEQHSSASCPCKPAPGRRELPARNRLISGLSLGVLVIEASERSGALITARLAAEDHGREVMAVPGRHRYPFRSGACSCSRAAAPARDRPGRRHPHARAGRLPPVLGHAQEAAIRRFVPLQWRRAQGRRRSTDRGQCAKALDRLREQRLHAAAGARAACTTRTSRSRSRNWPRARGLKLSHTRTVITLLEIRSTTSRGHAAPQGLAHSLTTRYPAIPSRTTSDRSRP